MPTPTRKNGISPTVFAATVFLFLSLAFAEPQNLRDDFRESLSVGSDLQGWTALGGRFRARDGVLTIDGGQGWLRSGWQYDNFVVHFEWRALGEGYDGGFLFKAEPSENLRPQQTYRLSLAEGRAGRVPGVEGAMPVGITIRPPGEWNEFDLTCLGSIGELRVNGKVAWEVANLDPRAGYLGLEADGQPVEFRNLLVREIGDRPLFTGTSLEGWRAIDFAAGWKAEEGVLRGTGNGRGWLSTADEYTNFRLRLEYRISPGGRGSVLIRTPRIGSPEYHGMEISLVDDPAPRFASLPANQSTGALFDVVAPSEHAARPAGAWNQLEILAKDRQVEVTLNGTPVLQTDLNHLGKYYSRHPGLVRRRGYVGLRHDGSGIEFRKLRIRKLR